MCKCSILTAIASGYAGRDPQGGFAMKAFKVLYWNLYENKTKVLLCFKEMKMKTSYVKVREKMVEWESEKSENDYVQMNWKRMKEDLEDVVIYTKEIKEKK